MKDKKILFVAPVLLVLLGLAYYFLYFIKTPGYAVKEIYQAVAQHNTTAFQKHVDVDSILDKAFDDLIVAESKINNDQIINNPFALSVLHMLKPTVVKLMKEQVLEEVAKTDNPANKKVDDPVSDAMRRNLQRKAHLDKLTFKDLKLYKENGDKASANVVVYNGSLNKDFAFNLSLLKNQDGVWQVKEITNLVAIIMQMDAADKALKAKDDKQVMARLSRSLTVTEKHLNVKLYKAEELAKKIRLEANAAGTKVPTIATNVIEKDSVEPCLTSKILTKNNSGKTIIRIYYDIVILGKDKNPIYSYPEHFDGSIPANATQEIVSIKRLNKDLPDDRDLAAQKDKELACNINITSLTFEDGSSIEPNQFVR